MKLLTMILPNKIQGQNFLRKWSLCGSDVNVCVEAEFLWKSTLCGNVVCVEAEFVWKRNLC